MDLSPVVAYATPLLGVVAAALLGARHTANPSQSGPFGSFLVAISTAVVIGLALTFVQVMLQSLCIEKLKLCPERGDRNMSYWFQSFVAIPLYAVAWFIAKAAPTGDAEKNPLRDAIDGAVVQALHQARDGQSVNATCPACHVVIRASLRRAPSAGVGDEIRTDCACGRCKGSYTLTQPRG